MNRYICIKAVAGILMLQVTVFQLVTQRMGLFASQTCTEKDVTPVHIGYRPEISYLQQLKNQELKTLGTVVQKIMADIQQAGQAACVDNQFFQCELPTCGFTCSVHFLTPCLLLALQSRKNFVIAFRNDTGRSEFKHIKRETFESTFLPVDKPCSSLHVATPITEIKGNNSPFEFDLTSVPDDVKRRVGELHSNPMAWWVGQAAYYLLKLRPEAEASIEKGFDFTQQIVGVHIRRTDKLKYESEYHSVEEYMEAVEEWFNRREVDLRLMGEKSVPRKRIFVATDDPTALDEITEKYPDYEVSYDRASINNAFDKHSRYTEIGIQHVALDVFRLTRCTFVVCTMTSNICRLVLELMQVKHGDDTQSVKSIDWRYNYHKAALPSWHVVTIQHLPLHDNELMLDVGDRVKPMTQDWRSGYWRGMNERNRKIGMYPDNKVVDFQNIR